MRPSTTPLALAVATLTASASAQEPPPATEPDGPRFAVALFGGAALPTGNVAPDLSMPDTLGLALAVGGDVGLRLNRSFEISLELLGLVRGGKPDACPPNLDECDKALGLVAAGIVRYYLDVPASLRPWLGGGVGMSWIKITDEQTSVLGSTTDKATTTYSGPLLIAQGGADVKLDPRLALGGFAGVYFGRTTSVSADGPTPPTGGTFQIFLIALRVSGSIPF